MSTPGTADPTPPAPPQSSGAQAAERLLTDLRSEIARADGKASVLVAALGMTAGVFSGLLAGREWRPGELSAAGAALWWAGVLALVFALFALLLAVLPRFHGTTWTTGRPLSYFGDIRQAVREGELARALVETERDPVAGLLSALTETSLIATRKHQWIRAGLIAFCTGTVLLPAALLIS
ncbi:Pycsar system effector family protein [Streptomyces sp. NPDC055189]